MSLKNDTERPIQFHGFFSLNSNVTISYLIMEQKLEELLLIFLILLPGVNFIALIWFSFCSDISMYTWLIHLNIYKLK